MEDIKERLLKIKAMADRGEYYEAKTSSCLLQILLLKYGLKIEDLDSDSRKPRTFKYRDRMSKTLLTICLENVIGYERTCESQYSPKKKIVFIELTDYEYSEVSFRYDWYCDDYEKEKKSIMKKLYDAYIIKRGLRFLHTNNSERNDSDDEYKKRILEAIELSKSLSDNSPIKKIENR